MVYAHWKVLVVEDEQDSVRMVSDMLRHYGAQVDVAGNGVEALEHLKQNTPTLIIMDLAMPELDGWQTLSHVRDNPGTADIPVIAITAFHSSNVAVNAREAGFNAYFPKPLDASSFVRTIAELIA